MRTNVKSALTVYVIIITIRTDMTGTKIKAWCGMNPREQRGLQLVESGNVEKRNAVYVVRSQTDKSQKYTVALGKEPYCSCPDHDNGHKCKHIFACEITLSRITQEQHADGSVTTTAESITVKRTTYRQNWPAYNEAQSTEKRRFEVLLADLCRNLPEEDQSKRRGPKAHLLRDRVFASVYKVYCGFSARRFSCDLEDAFGRGLTSRLIPGMKVTAFMEDESLLPILAELVAKSAAPLAAVESDFAVDSTGFGTSRYETWHDEKHGTQRSLNVWVKAHVAVGTKTNVITAVRILEKNSGDCPELPALVAKTAENFDVKEVSADKAYVSYVNFEAVAETGAAFFPLFKSNSTGGQGGLLEKTLHYFHFQREEYLSHYHKRSNVESTFSAVKRKFGDSVRSKTDAAMKAEVLCKFIAHNLTCLIQEQESLGIAPIFWKDETECNVLKMPATHLAAKI